MRYFLKLSLVSLSHQPPTLIAEAVGLYNSMVSESGELELARISLTTTSL